MGNHRTQNDQFRRKQQCFCERPVLLRCLALLLSQQMLPAIKRVAERCLLTKQYVAYGEIGHFFVILCSVISQGKVVALDR